MYQFRSRVVFISISTALFLACAARQQTPTVTTAPPPAPAPTVAATKTPETPPTTEVMFKDYTLHFDFDRDNLTTASQQRLQELSEVMRANRAAKIQIAGNCDERGTQEYNIALGHRRAEAAKRYLVSLGIDESRIDTVSYGKERPAVPEHNEAAWAENRRDEFAPQR
jgi:peptidoglycan-associated lipoprotein